MLQKVGSPAKNYSGKLDDSMHGVLHQQHSLQPASLRNILASHICKWRRLVHGSMRRVAYFASDLMFAVQLHEEVAALELANFFHKVHIIGRNGHAGD
jgi:hypothetical protein